jgi:hypothetical protein
MGAGLYSLILFMLTRTKLREVDATQMKCSAASQSIAVRQKVYTCFNTPDGTPLSVLFTPALYFMYHVARVTSSYPRHKLTSATVYQAVAVLTR